MLVGGTNARVGNECDGKLHFDQSDSEHDSEDTYETRLRTPNEDIAVNSNGEDILTWARAANLWILNGRVLPNTFTCFKSIFEFKL